MTDAAESLLREARDCFFEVDNELWERIDAHLAKPAVSEEYRRRNPLGGPAKVFDTMASRIRAGEDYYAVLDDHGFQVKPAKLKGPHVMVHKEFLAQLLERPAAVSAQEKEGERLARKLSGLAVDLAGVPVEISEFGGKFIRLSEYKVNEIIAALRAKNSGVRS